MLFSKFIQFIVTLFSWNEKESNNVTTIDMCNKTFSSAKTIYLFHENFNSSTHFSCMCHLKSSSRLTITIQRHFVVPLTGVTSYSKLKIEKILPVNVSSINMITDISPFGSDCLFGKKDKCLFNSQSSAADIHLNESNSFSRFVFKVKASKSNKVKINCNNKTIVFRQTVTANKRIVITNTSPETILYLGITLFVFVFAFIMVVAVILARKYRNNPVLGRVLPQKSFNAEQPVKNENDTKLKAPVDDDTYEDMSTGIPATHEATEKYEFCEIVDPQVEQESNAPPAIPNTPLPNKQINSLTIAYLEKQPTIEDEEEKHGDNTYSSLPSETPQHVSMSNDENYEDTYDHIPNSALLMSTYLSEVSHTTKSLENSFTAFSNVERRTSISRKKTYNSLTRRQTDGWYLDNVNCSKKIDELVRETSLPNYQRSKSAANIQDDINFAEVVAELRSYVNADKTKESEDQDNADYFVVLENELYQSL